MKTKKLTKTEQDYLFSLTNVKTIYATNIILSYEWALERMTNGNDQQKQWTKEGYHCAEMDDAKAIKHIKDLLNKAIDDRTKYLRQKYLANVDLKQWVKSVKDAERKAKNEKKQIANALNGMSEILLADRMGINLSGDGDINISVTDRKCSLKVYEAKMRGKRGRYYTYRDITLNIQKGYKVYFIGGVVTFIKGKINRKGVSCYWVTNERKQSDRTIVKGYLVKGEHIIANSLKQAIKINDEHRASNLSDILKMRKDHNADPLNADKLIITFEDSIKSGNCKPGTKAFHQRLVKELKHDVSYITGKTLMHYAKKFGLSYYAEKIIRYKLANTCSISQ